MACDFIYDDQVCQEILRDVVRQGGGDEEDIGKDHKAFIAYLLEYVHLNFELLKGEIACGKLKNYQDFLKRVAQKHWASVLQHDSVKLEKTINALSSDSSLPASVRRKIGPTTKRVETGELINLALTTFWEKAVRGEYQGKNTRAFIVTAAKGHWLNFIDSKHNKRTDPTDPTDSDSATFEQSEDLFDQILFSELVKQYLKSFKKLTKKCRHALYFALKEKKAAGWTREEIAKYLEYLTEKSLNNKISSCRKTWRTIHQKVNK